MILVQNWNQHFVSNHPKLVVVGLFYLVGYFVDILRGMSPFFYWFNKMKAKTATQFSVRFFLGHLQSTNG